MSIQYTYTIVKVDAEARCMEVVYSAAGHQTMHIGARLPYSGETLEDIISMYAPVAYWEEQKRQVVVPDVGLTGTIIPAGESADVQASTPVAIVTSLV
jgi:hypothetical protein